MISQNEIRRRAAAFAHEFSADTDEKGEASAFWEQFFAVFGVSRRRVASFEYRVKKAGGAQGFIDVFWPGVLLAEHKTKGRDLDKAYEQALTYLDGLADTELPRYIIVSDFAQMRLYDLEAKDQHDFPLSEFPQHIERFGFVSGYEVQKYEAEEAASIKAAELMAAFHTAIKDSGYAGHPLEVFLTRVLFCLFSEDTGIFEKRQFQHYVEQRTSVDGSDLGVKLLELFYILNTPPPSRQSTLDEQLAAFPYINGQIFSERLDPVALDSKARATLLTCCTFDWSQISAAIFGSLFQGVMDKAERRQLGAHYTSELNIMKVIEPLFLDELYTEFDSAKRSTKKLDEFHDKLTQLHFLDPACGCGNFLVTTYRELRKIELEVLKKKHKNSKESLRAFGTEELSRIHVNQFYGIEIEEFPALVARTAMYLADHQATIKMREAFGFAHARIPLEEPATIVHGNALTLDWKEVVPPQKLNYILGNPPFLGQTYQSTEQKQDVVSVLSSIKKTGTLDFVAAWYGKATEYMKENPNVQTALVSTNSITQGEQVSVIWNYLLAEGVHINFAHQTFRWRNEARGNAAVHCVIIGFGMINKNQKFLYQYADINGEPKEVPATNINPYLVDGPDLIIPARAVSICNAPKMLWGNKPTDGGNLILSPEEKNAAIAQEPDLAKYIHTYISGGDFLNDIERYCLWLPEANPTDLRESSFLQNRLRKVQSMRSESAAQSTREYAKYPSLFRQISQPATDYLAIPEVSSERREYIPMAFFTPDIICSNTVQFIANATLYHFGILTSKMHMTWVRYTCGRLKSDFRYSKDIVYNNFPWPGCAKTALAQSLAKDTTKAASRNGNRELPNTGISETHKVKIETAAQAVLTARTLFPQSSLADLYDPRTMPPQLRKAHDTLDRAVDQAYSYKENGSDPARIAFLFDLYGHIIT